MQALFQVLLASAFCVWGIILMIRVLKNLNKDILDSWLGFLKFFLGTFVIGLLGFFAKVSYENRQMAVSESEQIGKYVNHAVIDDVESRLRFAEYFSLVLPENHTTGWRNYYDTLKLKQMNGKISQLEKYRDESKMDNTQSAVDSLSRIENPTKKQESLLEEYSKRLDSLYEEIENKQKIISETQNINNEGSASIAKPDDFVTCTSVKNLMPIGRTSAFSVNSKVYVHAYIKSPKSESVEIIWKKPDGEIWNTTNSNIGINMGRGYRLFDHVRPKEKGEYSVEIKNEAGKSIGFKTFTVK